MLILEKFPKMISRRFHNRLGKVCALVAATLILPVLAYAGGGNNQGGNNQGGNNNNQGGGIPVVPETNAAWVLVPFFGAVLLLSARQGFRQKAEQKQNR